MKDKFVELVKCCIRYLFNFQKYQFQSEKKIIISILQIMEFRGYIFLIINQKRSIPALLSIPLKITNFQHKKALIKC